MLRKFVYWFSYYHRNAILWISTSQTTDDVRIKIHPDPETYEIKLLFRNDVKA